MHNPDLASALSDYEQYSALFANQVYGKDVWSEHTGCELEEEYSGYLTCCEARIYDFGTWYEQARSAPFPDEWADRREFKYSLVSLVA